jgi:hypothetical protein
MSKPWYEVQLWWGDEGWASQEESFNTIEEAEEYVEGNGFSPYRIIKITIVAKGGEQ